MVDFFTYETVAMALIVVLAACGTFVVIANVINIIKGWKKPHDERQQAINERLNNIDNVTARHQNDYRDVANLKRQMGSIQESVEKMDTTLDNFIKSHNEEMLKLNEETAIQTDTIKRLLNYSIDSSDQNKQHLVNGRQNLDEFLVYRGRSN